MDPRISRTREVVLDATLDELAESGYDGMTVEAIAKRAGVSKATVYRHWDGKEALVHDVLHRMHEIFTLPDTGPVRDRIIALVEHVAFKYHDGAATRLMPALVCASERHLALRRIYHDFVAEGRVMLADLIVEGVRSGELAPVPDIELAAGALMGPILVARMFTDERFDPARVPELVDWLLPTAESLAGRADVASSVRRS